MMFIRLIKSIFQNLQLVALNIKKSGKEIIPIDSPTGLHYIPN